jgi:hypothetical protein
MGDSTELRQGVPFAMDANGEWRDVDEVERGKACGCFCADCKGPLIARHGEVRVHHFAHDDRRDCRHALETSLFGMAISLLAEKDAVVALPSFGDRYILAQAAHLSIFRNRFRAGDVVVPESQLKLADAVFRARTIADSSAAKPDVVIPSAKVAIHFLSFQKPFRQLAAATHVSDFAVLGINLRSYAEIWWRVCDEQKEQRMKAAAQARDLMREWLSDHRSGRGWFYHPAVEIEKARLLALRETELLASRRHERVAEEFEPTPDESYNPEWLVPPAETHPEPTGNGVTATGSGLKPRPPEFMKPICAEVRSRITQDTAIELGLRWHTLRREWFYLESASEYVPQRVRRFLDPDAIWQPVRAVDREYLSRIRDPSTVTSKPSPPVEPITHIETIAKPITAPPAPDEIIAAGTGTCFCGAALNEVRFGNGYYQGRRGIRCSANSRHPTKIL